MQLLPRFIVGNHGNMGPAFLCLIAQINQRRHWRPLGWNQAETGYGQCGSHFGSSMAPVTDDAAKLTRLDPLGRGFV
jgi:hypothetical protein